MDTKMNRRGFVAGTVPLGAAVGAALGVALAGMAPGVQAADAAGVALDAMDVTALQAEMAAGRLSAVQLLRHYLKRIAAIDRRGPTLNAVIELNPDALAQARALDAERRSRRVRGPLHGIPVLLKDNIATADRMATSAGSLGLQGLSAKRDAFLVQRLREAGAVLLGKTNLSEWANIRSTRSSSGWSSRGGQTRNPHVLTRNTSGSSSGSAAAMAAGLAALTVGTETDGSIISPSSICGIVGLKPTVGRVSRDGVIPIAASQDTAGPMTRTVRDAALLLQAMLGADPRDAATANAPPPGDLLAALRPDALRGARIGVVRASTPAQPKLAALFDAALAVLRAQGAVLVDPVLIPAQEKYGETELKVLLHELKDGLPKYLAAYQPDAPFRDLAGLVAWNKANAKAVMPFFDQELLEQAEAGQGLQSPDYADALATNRRYARDEGLDKLFADEKLDAVVAPSGNLAWLIDHVLGDHYTGGGFTSPFAVAGYPHITVPMGFVGDLPAGLSIGALAWQEGRLLGLAHAYEQATRHFRAPRYVRA